MVALYNQYASFLFSIALRYTKSEDDAQDVLQDAFINIFENIKQYSGKGKLDSWMAKIVVNQALKLYQANMKRTLIDYDELENVIVDESVIDSDMLTHEILLSFIRQLPDGYRIVFNMYELEGYSYEEVAQTLNCTMSTARSQLFKAKRLLRKLVSQFLENEEQKVSKNKRKISVNYSNT